MSQCVGGSRGLDEKLNEGSSETDCSGTSERSSTHASVGRFGHVRALASGRGMSRGLVEDLELT